MRKIASKARKNINKELKNSILNSSFIPFLSIIGSLLKILIFLTIIIKNYTDFISCILIIWFSLMMVHDLIYSIYIILSIFATKSYHNQINKSPKKNLNDSYELTMVSCDDQENKARIDLKKNVDSENIVEKLVIEKECYWLRWIRISNFRFYFF